MRADIKLFSFLTSLVGAGMVGFSAEPVASPTPALTQAGPEPAPAWFERILVPPAFLARLGASEEQQQRIADLLHQFLGRWEQEISDRKQGTNQTPEAISGPPENSSPRRLAEELRNTMQGLQQARQDEDRETFQQGQDNLRRLMRKLEGLREAFEPELFTVLDDEQKDSYVRLKPELMRPGVLFSLMRPDVSSGPAAPPRRVDVATLKPLTDLAGGEYHGAKGGLYPDGSNERPPAHEAAGRALAAKVQPLDQIGKPGPKGKIVLLTIGMSNTMQATAGFQDAAEGDPELNPAVVIVNGAQGGQTAARTQDPEDHGSGTLYWKTVDERLASAGVSRAQVQAAWIKQADASPSQAFPEYARKLEQELTRIVQVLHDRFPNLKLVYLSSRTFGGFAKTPLNPEPYAYESGFSVKWLLERQIQGDAALNFDAAKGPVKAPWLSWGPYLWANGTVKRADGFSYEPSDFRDADGTHESPSGQRKVGRELLRFFKTDSTTKGWFVHQ